MTNIREYVDTQALARASETAASPRPLPIALFRLGNLNRRISVSA